MQTTPQLQEHVGSSRACIKLAFLFVGVFRDRPNRIGNSFVYRFLNKCFHVSFGSCSLAFLLLVVLPYLDSVCKLRCFEGKKSARHDSVNAVWLRAGGRLAIQSTDGGEAVEYIAEDQTEAEVLRWIQADQTRWWPYHSRGHPDSHLWVKCSNSIARNCLILQSGGVVGQGVGICDDGRHAATMTPEQALHRLTPGLPNRVFPEEAKHAAGPRVNGQDTGSGQRKTLANKLLANFQHEPRQACARADCDRHLQSAAAPPTPLAAMVSKQDSTESVVVMHLFNEVLISAGSHFFSGPHSSNGGAPAVPGTNASILECSHLATLNLISNVFQ